MMFLPLLLSFLAPQQSELPTTSILADSAVTVISNSPGSEFQHAEPGAAPVPMQEFGTTWSVGQIAGLPATYSITSFSRGAGAFYSKMNAPNFVVPDVADGGWSFMLFSVVGSVFSTDTPYAPEQETLGGTTGDIWAYMVPGSVMMPVEECGITHKVREGSVLGLGELGGMDRFIGTAALSPAAGAAADEDLAFGTKNLYFTVQDPLGSYALLPESWAGNKNDWRHPSTIFRMRYSAGSGWSSPVAWRIASELGLESSDAIVGLCVMDPEVMAAPFDSPGIEVLLSVMTELAEKLIWVCGQWRLSASGDLIPYTGELRMDGGGLFATEALRLDASQHRLAAICCDDPGGDSLISAHGRIHLERSSLIALGTERADIPLGVATHQMRWGRRDRAPTRLRVSIRWIRPSDTSVVLDFGSLHRPVTIVRDNSVLRQSRLIDIPLQGDPVLNYPWSMRVYDSGLRETGSRAFIMRLR